MNVFITGGWDDTVQIWDFAQAKSIKDIPEDPLFNSMTTGQLVDLPNAVYCVDNDRQGYHPKIAIGTGSVVSLVKNEKRS
ncbi:hypothetical protein KUTeg_009567 [Tegillarca granosa]|uniref:Uncharacterized protein n=1 Tax=Tegillarca granosa TaxID=220873 RepID=A0ABQ9F4D4_TEGGR|nr:hypothetical protein KUTeg_009567 [Tegillarca granosa]